MTKLKILLFGALAIVAMILLATVLFVNPRRHRVFHTIDLGSAIPAKVTPLAALNTEWDDYNTAPRFVGSQPWMIEFVWSTNRGSRGEDYDLWRASGILLEGGVLDVHRDPEPFPDLNSSANEFGPLHLPSSSWMRTRTRRMLEPEQAYSTVEMIFASDRPRGRGGLDLYFTTDRGAIVSFGLNSPANDAYFTWVAGDALFASDRNGAGYDIHRVVKPASVLAGRGLMIDNAMVVEELSSPADDTAPFLFRRGPDTLVVFASNRPGGYGGYDLWCSHDRDGAWAPPVNLGPTVNSSSDEFRPSVTLLARSVQTLVFSSNRPGGAGGFDLFFMRFPDPFELEEAADG